MGPTFDTNKSKNGKALRSFKSERSETDSTISYRSHAFGFQTDWNCFLFFAKFYIHHLTVALPKACRKIITESV